MEKVLNTPQGKIALTAGIAIVGSLVAWLAYKSSSENDELLPALDENITREVMAKILEQFKFTAANMFSQAENIKQKLEQSGQRMDEKAILQNFILPHVETALKDIQEKLLAEYDVEEYELEDAFNYYCEHGDAKLKDIGACIRAIFKQFGGHIEDDFEDQEEDVTDESAERKTETPQQQKQLVISILSEIGKKMADETQKFITKYKEDRGLPETVQEFTAFQMALMSLSEKVETEITEKYSVSQFSFQKMLQKFAESPEVHQLILNLQETNMMLMQSNGIDLMKFMSQMQ